MRLPYLVCVFKVGDADFAIGDKVATLKAKTKAGADVVATDAIVVKGSKKNDRDRDRDRDWDRDRDDDDRDCEDDD